MHHLRITNNVPLENIARFFAKICRSLLIEYVPKSDPMVKKLLENRENIFSDYQEEVFEHCFNEYFTPMERFDMQDTDRKLYLYKAKSHG